jgi:hypothetical protein
MPRKNGIAICTTIDLDANLLLRAMLPRSARGFAQGMGLLISELIRKEARERGSRAALAQVLRDTACAPAAGEEVS